MPDIDRIKEDLKPAAFIGASTAVMGAAGGLLPVVVHSIIVGGGAGSFSLLTANLAMVAGIGLGQGMAAAATAVARGRGEFYISPKRGFFGSLAVGAFNGLMYFTQMAVPSTELGWTLDLVVLGLAGAAVGYLAVQVPAKEPPVTIKI